MTKSIKKNIKIDVAKNRSASAEDPEALKNLIYEAGNPNTSSKRLEELSYYNNQEIKDAVLTNPSTPDPVRERLVKEMDITPFNNRHGTSRLRDLEV